jgi:hypothetical protein
MWVDGRKTGLLAFRLAKTGRVGEMRADGLESLREARIAVERIEDDAVSLPRVAIRHGQAYTNTPRSSGAHLLGLRQVLRGHRFTLWKREGAHAASRRDLWAGLDGVRSFIRAGFVNVRVTAVDPEPLLIFPNSGHRDGGKRTQRTLRCLRGAPQGILAPPA